MPVGSPSSSGSPMEALQPAAPEESSPQPLISSLLRPQRQTFPFLSPPNSCPEESRHTMP